MARPKFDEIFMDFAWRLSQRSTCKRLSVGTVITDTQHTRVLSMGYNGNAAGLANGCDREVEGNCGCLHSEENAVIKCDSPREVPKLVYITHLPCSMCAKRLINLGNVKEIVYDQQYRSDESLSLLSEAGIQIRRLVDVC